MRRAEKNDRALVVDILVKSFYDNRSVNHIVKQDMRKDNRITALMKYAFDLCLSFGEIWVSHDNEGCALTFFPKKKSTSLYSFLLDVKVAGAAIGLLRVGEVMKREKAIKLHHPKEDITYLWFIGVNPKSQHRGIGSALLLHVIEQAKSARRAIYLETSVETNVMWYKGFDFEVFKTLEFSYTLFLLRRME
jgi:ribosomal protein S18 acetylase RimI-like enzyme